MPPGIVPAVMMKQPSRGMLVVPETFPLGTRRGGAGMQGGSGFGGAGFCGQLQSHSHSLTRRRPSK